MSHTPTPNPTCGPIHKNCTMTRKVPGFEDPSASERRACLCIGMPVMQGTYNNVFVAGPFEVTEEECIIFWDKREKKSCPMAHCQAAVCFV